MFTGFAGYYEHSIDAKGRLAIPAKFRAQLAGGLALVRSPEPCLVIMDPEQWRVLQEHFSVLPFAPRDARRLQRFIFPAAAEVRMDRLGRILIPQYLRAYAGLTDTVIIAGMSSYAEIWDKKAYLEELSAIEGLSSQLTEQLAAIRP